MGKASWDFPCSIVDQGGESYFWIAGLHIGFHAVIIFSKVPQLVRLLWAGPGNPNLEAGRVPSRMSAAVSSW